MAQRILVAFDESPQAHAALRHALTTYPEAEISVLHVNDPREYIYSDEMGGYYSDEAFERAKRSAEDLLAGAEDIAREHDAEIATTTETGRVARTIVDYLKENDVDHVVLGSHGRSGLSRFLLGSVAESVARRSPTSVTIIREADATAGQ